MTTAPPRRGLAPPSSGDWRQRPRFWTPARLFQLAGLIEEGCSDAQIGAHFGRSANAVILARKHYGLRSRTRAARSAARVARDLGLSCPKTVVAWIQAGALLGRRGQPRGAHHQWLIEDAALLAFLDDPAHWHLWQPERLRDPAWRAHYLAARTERYLTQAEVADRCYVVVGTVGSWLDAGLLPFVRVGSRGNRLVPERALATFTPPGQRPRPPVPHRRWSADDDRRLRSLRAEGWSWSRIGLRLGRTTSAVSNRFERLERRRR